ncbi:PLAC8 family-domain-containing protein [Panaeolus papilionaceus]|nr:PLAC8 family-domain-containing protein [Panaeolus papilionaceus]
MVVVPGGGGNRNAMNIPVDDDGRKWSHGLCGCCGSCGTCVISCCFPCVTYGQNRHRFEHLSLHGAPNPNHHGKIFSGSCFQHGLLTMCGLGFLMQMGTRGAIRSRYNIKGGSCGDCCTSCFCGPCALTQESRELDLEEQSFLPQRY